MIKTIAYGKIITEINYTAEVSSNGESVWVNKGDECLARFNKLTREYKNLKPLIDQYTIYHNNNYDTDSYMYYCWEAFVMEVSKRFGVKIDQEHTPNYIPAGPINIKRVDILILSDYL